MQNDENIKNNELIPLLIEYKKVTGYLFPIEKVKYVSDEDLIPRIQKCIETKTRYDFKSYKLDKIQVMSDNDLKKVIPLIIKSMEALNYDYKTDIENINKYIKDRLAGKKFSFSDHLRALILTQLSNHRWGDSNIRNNIDKIDAIFHNFDKNYLKVVDPNDLVTELKEIHCTNPMIKNQMKSILHNISVFELIEKEYGTLDNYVLNNSPSDIANSFVEGKYELRQIGYSFTYDYLKRVGINTCKYSIQMERMFGCFRLGIVSEEKSTHGQAITILKKLSKINNMSEVEVESIIQQFCLLRSANICGEIPNCEKCKLRDICHFNK